MIGGSGQAGCQGKARVHRIRTTAAGEVPDTAGKPTATPFTNDASKTTAGQGRLTVCQVAAALAVDVLAGTMPLITGPTDPKAQNLNLPPAAGSVSVAAARTATPRLIGPADFPVEAGQNTLVYAQGPGRQDARAVAVQTITELHTPPAGVPAGETGAARPEVTGASTETGVRGSACHGHADQVRPGIVEAEGLPIVTGVYAVMRHPLGECAEIVGIRNHDVDPAEPEGS